MTSALSRESNSGTLTMFDEVNFYEGKGPRRMREIRNEGLLAFGALNVGYLKFIKINKVNSMWFYF